MGIRFISREYSISKLLVKLEEQLGFPTKIRWSFSIMFFSYHIFAVYWSCLFAFPAKWQTLLFALVMYIFSGSGVSTGVHRLWTHKSYKARLPLRIYLMLGFASSGQNSIYAWTRDHRVHHKFSDTAADPHDSSRGFWFSHVGWLCLEKNALVIEKGRLIDMSDIESDPVVVFEKKYTNLLSLMFCFVLPTLTGIILWGESWKCAVAWQCCIRFLGLFHAEMSVNSFAHMFGSRPYSKKTKATQNLFVSLVTVAEGGHNYHHAFPNDFRTVGVFDFFNFSELLIRAWARLGLAYDLKQPSPEMVQKMIEKHKE